MHRTYPHAPSTKLLHLATIVVLVAASMVSTALPRSVAAATISITTTADEFNQDGDCSLREAIRAANTDTAVDGCLAGSGPDTITLEAGTHFLEIAGREEDAGLTGDFDIDDDLMLRGAGRALTTINGFNVDSERGRFDRIFHIMDGVTVTLTNLTILDGNASGEAGFGGAARGGAILNAGVLRLDEIAVRDSRATGNNGADGLGGAIYSSGSLTVVDTLIEDNRADAGAAPEDPAEDQGVGRGGGIFSSGPLTLIVSTVGDNQTASGEFAADAGGAGIWSDGAALLLRSTVRSNIAAGGQSGTRGGGIRSSDTLVLNLTTIASNTAIAGLSGSQGGGIWSSGVLTATESTLLNNTALSGSAGQSDPDTRSGAGGALANSGSATLIRSTISANVAGGSGGDGQGGGISNSGTLSTINTTISGNLARGAQQGGAGGGMYNAQDASVALTNTTIVSNTVAGIVPDESSGGGVFTHGTLTFTNTIIAYNADTGAIPAMFTAADCAGTLASGGHNLIQSPGNQDPAQGPVVCTIGRTTSGNRLGVDPELGMLQDNGGPTQTHLPLLGSPVIDAGDNAACPAIDQRRSHRPQDTTCDIGAVEVGAIGFNATNYTVDEGDDATTITVTLNSTTTQTVTVQYAASAGTASAGSDFTPVSGALTLPPGTRAMTFTVPMSDDIEAEPDETVRLTLSAPTNADLGNATATLTIVDDDTPARTYFNYAPMVLSGFSVDFSTREYRAVESAGAVTITVALSSTSPQAITVDYATQNGTARAGSDYTPVRGTLTFAPRTQALTFTVPISDDAQIELDETVLLRLSNATNIPLSSTTVTTLTIVNDDLPRVGLSTATYRVAESIGAALITATLSSTSPQTVTTNYATGGGTATAGTDYSPIGGTLTFSPGTRTVTFTVPINDDTQIEPDETVGLTLSDPVNVVLGSTRAATMTIVNDDQREIAFSAPDYTGYERDGGAIITVTLSSTATQTTTVDYATGDGTARAGSDYTPVTGTLIFAPGTAIATLIIPIIGDRQIEPDETLTITLANPTNAVLANIATATLTIVSDDAIPAGRRVYLPMIARGSGTASMTINYLPIIVRQE